tara:strand:- start:56 stop:427 length:372 start_codon:yes stop_codon:yes gene_type:complete
MSQTRTISSQSTHLSWDSILAILFAAVVYYGLGRISTNQLHSIYYFGCSMGVLQCLIIHEGGLYIIYILENYGHIDLSRLFGHIQLAPYTPQNLSDMESDESDDDEEDDGYSEGSEDEKEKDD